MLKWSVAVASVAVVAVGGAGAWGEEPTARAADRDCSDFPNQRAAQDYFKRLGSGDPDGLDADGDGQACDSLPCPCGSSPRPSPRPNPSPPARPPRPPKRYQTIRSRIIDVIDGDTIRVRTLEPTKKPTYTVRLIGIDTPETKKPGTPVECGGREATSSMFDLGFPNPRDSDEDGLFDKRRGQGRRLKLVTDPTQDTFDGFGRLLAYADLRGGPTLGGAQLKRGWSKVYIYRKPFQQLRSFRAIAKRARRARHGVWKLCGGKFHSRDVRFDDPS